MNDLSPPPHGLARLSRPGPLRRWPADARGATAVEFGLVALPFLALLGAIIQVAFTIWAQQNFDYSFQKAIRTVFTGQFQANNAQGSTDAVLLAAFQKQMCGVSSVFLFDCSGVKLDISIGNNFANSNFPSPIDASTRDWNPNFGANYTCASPGAIVIATAAVKFPVIFSLLDAGLSNFADGSKLLMSTAIFRTEPYVAATATPCSASSSS